MARKAGLAALAVVLGCTAVEPPGGAEVDDRRLVLAEDSAVPPPGAPAGTCYARDRTPAVIETVTEKVVAPALAADGTETLDGPPGTRTTHRVARAGESLLFETPCIAQMTPAFVASLQRALAARGHYRGPVTGAMDQGTRVAVRTYQRSLGLDSAILARETALKLGLLAYDRPTAPPAPG